MVAAAAVAQEDPAQIWKICFDDEEQVRCYVFKTMIFIKQCENFPLPKATIQCNTYSL